MTHHLHTVVTLKLLVLLVLSERRIGRVEISEIFDGSVNFSFGSGGSIVSTNRGDESGCRSRFSLDLGFDVTRRVRLENDPKVNSVKLGENARKER
jgi:hypothetical protein